MKKYWIVIVLLFLTLAIGTIAIFWGHASRNETPIATVPGPSPVASSTSWTTATDTKITFEYPKPFPAKFLTPVEWPPTVGMSQKTFSCVEKASDDPSSQGVSLHKVNGRSYCVTEESEGAAGSVYTTYAYATARTKGTLLVSFTLRAPRCENYEDPEKSLCGEERESFDLDALVDGMVKSVKL